MALEGLGEFVEELDEFGGGFVGEIQTSTRRLKGSASAARSS
jgi:hypothetical protein